jgi:hypothetical protein
MRIRFPSDHLLPPIRKLHAEILYRLQVLHIHLPGARRRTEGKAVRRDFVAGLPVSDLDAVLGLPGHKLGRKGIPARIGMRSLGDPDLPVHILLAECEVIALGTADHATAEIFRVDHIGHEFVVGIGYKQISRRQRPGVPVL